MSKKTTVSIPGDRISQAFMAALLAAARGDDGLAGDILREIADQIAGEFKPKAGSGRGGQE